MLARLDEFDVDKEEGCSESHITARRINILDCRPHKV